jgi:hypothetical protein
VARQNTVLLNVSAGETTPEIYGRIDLPAYQRSYQRVQNYEVLPQGALRYRNGTQHVRNTASLGTGRLIPFTFNQIDTYMLEFTNKLLRFYRDFGGVLSPTTFAISSITNANPGVITTATNHGYSTGQEVYLSGIVGMPELNNQFFLITVTGVNTFTLTDLFGNAIDTTNFIAYISGGVVATSYQIPVPYMAVDLNQVHISQSGDTMILTHQDYMPYKLTRTALTSWSINFFTRVKDPFGQGLVTAATAAALGVFTLAAHGFKVGDTLYFDGWAGGTWTSLNQQPRTFTVNTVPTGNTFTVSQNGTPLNTSTFGAIVTHGTVIDTQNCPQTSAFMSMSRLVYANWRNNPSGIVASELPNSTTGATNFDNFTPGANDNNAFYFTLAPIFNQQDAIQWITTNNSVVVIGCSGTIRQLTGSNGPTSPITPSSISAQAISNTGAAPIQPYANGLTVFYVDQTTFRVNSFIFNIQVYNYVTLNQNLISNQLSTSPFILLAQQRRESSLLWILRADGVLAGMTFNEIESIYGWHRHYMGGQSAPDGVTITRANVLSMAVQPMLADEAVLWVLVEREFSNGQTYRSVEYWNDFIRFFDPYDYFGGESTYEGQEADVQAFKNATSEQLKNSIHLDCNLTYNGTRQATLTFSSGALDGIAPVGTSILVTASQAVFTAADVGSEVWQAYDLTGRNTGGRATIAQYLTAETMQVTALTPFDLEATCLPGAWYVTTGVVYGLINFAGETLGTQVDGSPGGNKVVGTDGSIALDAPASMVQVGRNYLGLLASHNLDAGGVRGTAQGKIRKIREIIARFLNSVAARVGTSLWTTRGLVFMDQDDLTDMPAPLYSDVLRLNPEDSWQRMTKQVIVMQDVPAPQTILSLDVMIECADE